MAAAANDMLVNLSGYRILVIELAVVFFAAILPIFYPLLFSGWFNAAERVLGQLARKRKLALIAVGLVALAIRAALLPVTGIPKPAVPDEFSYLLAADTFTSGRCTNPPHPMWRHFESLHILQQPSYMSKYPPAQGLALAAGERIIGHPWFGVWASIAAMCAAICWMLQGWLPPGWALLGGLVAAIRLGTFSYWSDGYWGGAVAATGGALVLGALPRMIKRLRVRDALLMGLGLTILANSRLYEGFVLAVAAVAVFVYRITVKKPAARRRLFAGALLPAGLLLLVSGGALAYYNSRVTGDPLLLPYVAHERMYLAAPLLLWQGPRPEPAYRHEAMREFHAGFEVQKYESARSAAGFSRATWLKLMQTWLFYIGPVLTIPLFALPAVLRDKKVRPLILIGAVFAAALAFEVFYFPHYSAPATALIYAVLIQGMRHLRLWRPEGRPTGLFLARAVPTLCIAMLGVRVLAGPLHLATVTPTDSMTWYSSGPPFPQRQAVLDYLTGREGKHLVVVCYGPGHNVHQEWVYNDADIDGAKVVWAREMDEASNEELVEYFQDRRAWVVEADREQPRLASYWF